MQFTFCDLNLYLQLLPLVHMLGGDMNMVGINHHDGTKTIASLKKEADDNTWDGL